MRKFFFLAACFLGVLTFSSQVSIECNYSTYTYEVLGNIYRCDVKNTPNIINQESSQITSTYGIHQNGKSNNEVIGFHAARKNLHLYPKGLDKNFKNLKSIYIYECKLTEIHQDDLKPFPNLVFLYLFSNFLTIIEPGLFDFNQNLEYISIGDNKIVHIDANVFDGLTKLWHLHLNGVPCFDKYTCTFGQTQTFIKELRSKCKDPEFVEIEDKMKSLEDEAGTLSFNEFNTKVDDIAKDFVNSRLFSNAYLKSKFEALKFMTSSSTQSNLKPQNTKLVPKTCTNCCQLDQISTLDIKIGNMSEIVRTLKPFQDEVDSQLSGISSLFTEQGSKLNELQVTLENIQSHNANFEVKTNEKFEEMKEDLASTRHKMAINFDEKIKSIEKRLIKKFEDALEEKLSKMLDEKLGSIVDARLGTE